MARLEVTNLHTQFETPEGIVRAVDGVSFTVETGEIVGLVGESGSGKSVTGRSIMGLHAPGTITEGSIEFDGVDLTAISDRRRQQYRGSRLSMVFQDPTSTLNPVFDVGEQIAESLHVHGTDSQSLLDYLHVPPFTNRSAWNDHRERAVELMEQVGISDPADRAEAYPHELSGGMKQRAMLAIALAGDPDLLICDEPTTALDTTTQARILDRLHDVAERTDTAIIVISHDFGVVADLCDRTVVLYGGQVMERGPTDRLLDAPEHPYTQGLLACARGSATDGPAQPIEGSVPDRFDGGPGCPFADRCSYATEGCFSIDPPAVPVGDDHRVRCSELTAIRQSEPSTQPRPDPSGDTATAANSSAENRPKIAADSTAESQQTALDGGAVGGTARTFPGTDTDSPADSSSARPTTEPILEARSVSKRYPLSDSLFDRLFGNSRTLRAVDDVDVAVHPGETVGIVGESGSGKSTLAKLLTGLEAPSDGEIRFDGEPVGTVDDRTVDQLADVGVVFQTPQSSINPRQTVRAAIAEPLYEQGWDRARRDERVAELLELVELPPSIALRRPHQLSGGQLQRVAIARAIAPEPSVVVFDEPVSALDVSIRATLLRLLDDLQERLGLTYVVISHDLDVIRQLANRVAVMYLGQIVERGPAGTLLDRPSHPYTAALLDAVPGLDDDHEPVRLDGPVPSGIERPSGCSFHPRCPAAEPECSKTAPELTTVGEATARCHFAADVAAGDVPELGESAPNDNDDAPDDSDRANRLQRSTHE